MAVKKINAEIALKAKRYLSKLKKNLQLLIAKDEELWFFDESQFGFHSKVGMVGLKKR